jgi:hypothetical protein
LLRLRKASGLSKTGRPELQVLAARYAELGFYALKAAAPTESRGKQRPPHSKRLFDGNVRWTYARASFLKKGWGC